METRVGILLVAQDLASGNIAKVEKDLRSLGPAGSAAAFGISGLHRAATGIGGAFSHLKSQIGNLVSGPLGFIGLGAGLFSIEKLFHESVDKVTSWGLAIEKLTGLTGDSAEQMSGFLAITEKFGISAERAGMIVGFTEKSLGNIAKTTKGAAKFMQEYGFSVLDAHGKVKDFNTVLLQVADYYNSSASASQKAALAAKIFGRGYADLVPILKLGSQGIRDAEAAAAQLGLTLTAQNVQDLAKYREGMRELGDAVGGLQLQIGLHLVPVLIELAHTATTFISDNRAGILKFLDSAIEFGRGFASFVGGTLIPTLHTIGSAAMTAWNMIPSGLRDLLVKGFVANKVVKLAFGIDIAGDIGKGIGNAVAQALGHSVASSLVSAGIGKAFVQPVFVTNPGFGGLPGAAGGAGEAAAAAGGGELAAVGGIGALAGPLAAVAGATLGIIALTKVIIDATGGDAKSLAGKNATAAARGIPAGQVPQNLTRPNVAGDWYAQHAATQLHADLAAQLASEDESHKRLAENSAALAQATVATKVQTKASAQFDKFFGGGLKDVISGIEKRSAEKYGGKGLGQAAVDATFNRDLLRAMNRLVQSGATSTDKLSRLETLLHLAQQKGDVQTAAKITAAIHHIKASAKLTVTVKAPAGESSQTSASSSGSWISGSGTSGYTPGGAARGLMTMTRGHMNLGELGFAGEVGDEAVMVVKGPKPLRSLQPGASSMAVPPQQVHVTVLVGAGQIMRAESRAKLLGGTRRVTING